MLVSPLTQTTSRYRAPELLLKYSDYDSGVDMWSAGCVFAELLSKERGDSLLDGPLFPGSSPRDGAHSGPSQLSCILDLLGRPSDDAIDRLSGSAYSRDVDLMKSKPVRTVRMPDVLKRLFPASAEPARLLLAEMLRFDPTARQKVDEIFFHSYFEPIFAERDESLRAEFNAMAGAPGVTLDGMEFEDAELSATQLREQLLMEVDAWS